MKFWMQRACGSAIFALVEQKIYYVVAWNKLYRRNLFDGLRYARGKRYEDQFLLPKLLARCQTIACLGYPGYRYVQRSGSIMAQGNSRNYLDRSEYLLEWCGDFAARQDFARAEGLLNDAIQNLSEKERFDLSTPRQRARYRADCRACAAAYGRLARRTGQKTMWLRAALLRFGIACLPQIPAKQTVKSPCGSAGRCKKEYIHGPDTKAIPRPLQPGQRLGAGGFPRTVAL